MGDKRKSNQIRVCRATRRWLPMYCPSCASFSEVAAMGQKFFSPEMDLGEKDFIFNFNIPLFKNHKKAGNITRWSYIINFK